MLIYICIGQLLMGTYRKSYCSVTEHSQHFQKVKDSYQSLLWRFAFILPTSCADRL